MKRRTNKKEQYIPEEEEGFETPPQESENFAPENIPRQKFPKKPRSKSETGTQQTSRQYILHPKHRSEYVSIIKGKANQYKVDTKSESILGENKRPITNSNYKDVLDYLTGNRVDVPPGTDTLLGRIENEKWFKEALVWADYYRQRGEGKRRRHSYIKHTKGLIRVKKPTSFKPMIWERI